MRWCRRKNDESFVQVTRSKNAPGKEFLNFRVLIRAPARKQNGIDYIVCVGLSPPQFALIDQSGREIDAN